MRHPYGDTMTKMSKRAFRLRLKSWRAKVEMLRYLIRCKEEDARRQPANASGYLSERERLASQLSDALAGLNYWTHHARQAGAIPSEIAA